MPRRTVPALALLLAVLGLTAGTAAASSAPPALAVDARDATVTLRTAARGAESSPSRVPQLPEPSPTGAGPSDPITRTVQVAVVGAVLLGLAGAAGLYLTRGR